MVHFGLQNKRTWVEKPPTGDTPTMQCSLSEILNFQHVDFEDYNL